MDELAHHEAGHAVVGAALGARVTMVTIERPAKAKVDDLDLGLSFLDRAAIYLSGPVAERWSHRHMFVAPDEFWIPWIGLVREFGGGGCDECRATWLAFDAMGRSDDASVIAALRRAEARAHDLVRDPPIWRAIRAVAAALIEGGTLHEDTVTAICAEHFAAGAYRLENADA